MPFRSTLPNVTIPECNILSYLFPLLDEKDERPLWINAKDPEQHVHAHSSLLLVRRLGATFDKLRIPKGSTIMVVAPNHIYVPIAYLATAGSGRIFTASNPSYTVSELVHQIKTIRAQLILAHPDALPKVIEAAAEAGVSNEKIFQFSDQPQQPHAGIRDWRTILVDDREGRDWQWAALEGPASHDTIAVINFSSGTTGLPKGVCITHNNIVANAAQVIAGRMTNTSQSVERPDSDRWLAFLPWYHAYAQLFSIVITCKLRQAVYAMTRFELEPYLQYISKYKITTWQVVPPVLVMLSKRQGIEECNLSSVKYVMSAAAPLKRDLQNDISKKLGATIAQSWGMTETTCTGLMSLGEDEDRTGSVGYLLPGTEAKLMDENGNEVKAGEAGELWIKGPLMMYCYWENESATTDTLTTDKWLKTGDVAEHSNGKFWIVDRRKELIKVRGFQVAPAELEALLLEHEEVADCAVVALQVNDEERPRAYVALQNREARPTSAITRAIEQYVTEKAARHKHLTGGVVVVESIPRLLSGKIQRKIVKEWAQRDAERLVTAKSKL